MAKKYKRAESRVRYFIRSEAKNKGWDVNHPQRGGDFLEEQEIESYFPALGLYAQRPDFLACAKGEPIIVIEAKNSFRKINEATEQAIGYCDKINSSGKHCIKIAIGVAGEPDYGYIVRTLYYKDKEWHPVKAKGNVITAFPSKDECLRMLEADNSTMELAVPSMSEFIDAAIEISNILRTAKIEPVLRPKVVGAFVTALYQGDVALDTKTPLQDINELLTTAIQTSNHFSEEKKQKLIEAITLGVNDFERLSPYVFRIISLMKKLNVRSVLQSDVDFLGMFYEAFLRYGSDNNSMGIVFTPRHITRLCADLANLEVGHKIIDITCGTGGFLVAAFDCLKDQALTDDANSLIRKSIYGFDTNPTVWALSCLNMFFRGDGKSNIENASSLEENAKASVKGKFNRAFLNPPFSQQDEPERDFIDASMDSLIQGGLFIGVIYAGIFADEENALWRSKFMDKHTILAMVSLPDELFYPNASAITTIMIAKAHVPQPDNSKILVGRIENDGFTKLKGKRISCEGSQIPELKSVYRKFILGENVCEDNFVTIDAENLRYGAEFSPQEYMPPSNITAEEEERLNKATLTSLFQAVTAFPEITDCLIEDFNVDNDRPELPLGITRKLSFFFEIATGKSKGVKTYADGCIPYVSSGDNTNGIVKSVIEENDEICAGCITVSAFGTAYLQPWKYMARGNGGSSVRVLIPKFKMTNRELFWFISQINSQKWRFTYARQAIKSRLNNLNVTSPSQRLDEPIDITEKINMFKEQLSELSRI